MVDEILFRRSTREMAKLAGVVTLLSIVMLGLSFLYLQICQLCFRILSLKMFGWWLGISYLSVVFLIFVVFKVTKGRGSDTSFGVVLMLSLMWWPAGFLFSMVLVPAVWLCMPVSLVNRVYEKSRISEEV